MARVNKFWPLKVFGQIGKRRGFDVRGGPEATAEYRYDHTWLDTRGMPMALECEWSRETDKVDYDFLKIVLSRGDPSRDDLSDLERRGAALRTPD
jgi:hypothetical protein